MDEAKHKLHGATMTAYTLLLIGLLLQCGVNVALGSIGILLMLVGIVIAYAKRGAARGSYLESHYRWMVRTMWIGGAMLCVGILVSAGLLIAKMDMQMLNQMSGDPETGRAIMTKLMHDNVIELLIPQLPGILWWSWRRIRGMVVLQRLQPIYKPGAAEAI